MKNWSPEKGLQFLLVRYERMANWFRTHATLGTRFTGAPPQTPPLRPAITLTPVTAFASG